MRPLSFLLLGTTALLIVGCTNATNPSGLRIHPDPALAARTCLPSRGKPVTSGPWTATGTALCVWDAKGIFVAALIDDGLFPEPNGEYITNRMGILPKEKQGVYVLSAGDAGKQNAICTLEALDIGSPSKRVTVSFDPQADVELDCTSGLDEVELDLAEFTFDNPRFRYRIKRHSAEDLDAIESVGPWTQAS